MALVLCITEPVQSGYIIELQEPDKELNVNRYATKKTAAQGKLDTRAWNEGYPKVREG